MLASANVPDVAMVWIATVPRVRVAKSKRTSARWPGCTVTRLPAGPVCSRFAARTATSIVRGAASRFCTITGSENASPCVRNRGAMVRALTLRCATITFSALPNHRLFAVASATMRNRVKLSGILIVTVALPAASVCSRGENTAVARKSLRDSTIDTVGIAALRPCMPPRPPPTP